MYHASNYQFKIVMTAFNKKMETLYCVALTYSSDEKKEECESFWKLLASSIQTSLVDDVSIDFFESSTRKLIHCTKLFTTTLKSYILFEILRRLRGCQLCHL